MSTDLNWLWSVLQKEGESGATNDLAGGIDAVMRAAIRGEPRESIIRKIYRNLPSSGYSGWGIDERKLWLKRALATIESELKTKTIVAPKSSGSSSAKKRAAGTRRSKSDSHRTSAKKNMPPGDLGLDMSLSEAGSGLTKTDLKKLADSKEIHTIRDALYYFPRAHNDYSTVVTKATELVPDSTQTFRGTVRRTYVRKTKRGLFFAEAVLNDVEGRPVKAIWFNLFRNQSQIAQRMPTGADVALAGRVKLKGRSLEFQAPEIEKLDADEAQGRIAGRYAPVYGLTEGVSQQKVRGALSRILEKFLSRIDDPLPEKIRKGRDLMPLQEAILNWHLPPSEEMLMLAQRRISFDQLLVNQLQAIDRRNQWVQGNGHPFVDHSAAEAFMNELPFTLTTAQSRALSEIQEDISASAPMASSIASSSERAYTLEVLTRPSSACGRCFEYWFASQNAA